MKKKYDGLKCKKCGRRITTPVDKNYNPLYEIHSCKIDLELCYHCVGLENDCRCNDGKG